MSDVAVPAPAKRLFDSSALAIMIAIWLSIFANPVIGLAAGFGVHYLATFRTKRWTWLQIAFALAMIAVTYVLVDIYDHWGAFKAGFAEGYRAAK